MSKNTKGWYEPKNSLSGKANNHRAAAKKGAFKRKLKTKAKGYLRSLGSKIVATSIAPHATNYLLGIGIPISLAGPIASEILEEAIKNGFI